MPQENDEILCVLTTIWKRKKHPLRMKQLKELKETVKRGIKTPEKISKMFPKICCTNPLLVMRCVTETTPESSGGQAEHIDWVNAGSPSGLPLKVHRKWKEGERCHASREEWLTRRTTPKDMTNGRNGNSLAKNVYLAWVKGYNTGRGGYGRCGW